MYKHRLVLANLNIFRAQRHWPDLDIIACPEKVQIQWQNVTHHAIIVAKGGVRIFSLSLTVCSRSEDGKTDDIESKHSKITSRT